MSEFQYPQRNGELAKEDTGMSHTPSEEREISCVKLPVVGTTTYTERIPGPNSVISEEEIRKSLKD